MKNQFRPKPDALIKFVFILGFLFLGNVTSASAYRVPSLAKLTKTSGFKTEKNLKENTTVVGSDYKVEIPKGWTIRFTGESEIEKLKSAFIALSDDSDRFDSPYTFSINEPKKPLNLASVEKVQAEKGRTIKKIKTSNFEGISVEYVNGDDKIGVNNVIVQYMRSKEKSFIVMALYPVKATEKDRGAKEKIIQIVNSLKFN